MSRKILYGLFPLLLLGLAGSPALAAEGDGEETPVDAEKLYGEEVTETSRLEELLATEFQKRRTVHFFLETGYPMEQARDYIRFCEERYAGFLKWAGLPANHKLWGTRAHVVVFTNKGEWEAYRRYSLRHLKPKEIEMRLKVSGTWRAQPPMRFIYSREGASPTQDKLHLLHGLMHIMLHGLCGSGRGGFLPWLFEAFSFHWELEIFGGLSGGCVNFETQAKKGEERAWTDPDDWIKLLKREVKKKKDEDFVLFWHKDLSSLSKPTLVKSWSLIQYFLRDEDAKGDFVRFLKLLKDRKDLGKGLKMVWNATPDDIDKAWRKWVKKQRSRKLTKGRDRKKRGAGR
jgi:hypothetical protein